MKKYLKYMLYRKFILIIRIIKLKIRLIIKWFIIKIHGSGPRIHLIRNNKLGINKLKFIKFKKFLDLKLINIK